MSAIRVTIFIMVLLKLASSRHLPRFSELEDEDKDLFRAAYDTPSYDTDAYEEDDDLNKLDLAKDGLWAIKAKLKELKAFDKALAANFLSTKLKIKDLLKTKPLEVLMKHHHEKPSYNYQSPPHQQPPYGPQYPAQHYSAPAYSAPTQPAPAYSAPAYTAPAYTAPAYSAPSYPPVSYSEPAPQYGHDPYYGH